MNQRKIYSHTQSPRDFALPWSTSETWHEANQSVRHHLERYRSHLGFFEKLFRDVENGMALIFSMLDELCGNTCPWCPEPCCLSATVWFDFPDLLFLHAGGSRIPPAQPRQGLKTSCRYLRVRGCSLPRISRPWICTWYLCDSQLACLRKKGPKTQAVYERTLQAIKAGRKAMEEEFIRIVGV